MTRANDVPNPGHPDAVKQGCTCPVVDNAHGRGSYKGDWIIAFDCPLHAPDDREGL